MQSKNLTWDGPGVVVFAYNSRLGGRGRRITDGGQVNISMRLFLKNMLQKAKGVMASVVKHLPTKYKALSLNTNTAKKKRRKNRTWLVWLEMQEYHAKLGLWRWKRVRVVLDADLGTDWAFSVRSCI
jgi:hypothetical protein